MKYLILVISFFLLCSIACEAQSQKEKERFVKRIYKDFKRNRIDDIAKKFVDSIYIDKVFDDIISKDPKLAKRLKKEKIHKQRRKAAIRLRESLRTAYQKIATIHPSDLKQAKLINIEFKEKLKVPVASFRGMINFKVDTTLVQLELRELTYDKTAKVFYILGDRVRYKIFDNNTPGEEAIEMVEAQAAEIVEERDYEEIGEAVPPPPPPRKISDTELEGPEVEEVFQVAKKMPEFPGGEKKMYEYFVKKLRYPEVARDNNIQGKVYVSFVVSKDGSLKDIKILRGIGYGCDEEVIRMILLMPKWKPGTQGGKPVRVRYTLPVSFKLN